MSDMTQLSNAIQAYLCEQVSAANRPELLRAPICGFSSADNPQYQQLKTIVGPWHAAPKELLPSARSVISYFIPITQEVIQDTRLKNPTSAKWVDAYVVINRLCRKIGDGLAALLEQAGYPSLNVAATHNFDEKTLRASWSHRSAAAIAGLGSFGVNRMLITEKGCAGRFSSVITAAPLPPSPAPAPQRCLYYKNGSCQACLTACPTKALQADALNGHACYQRCLDNARHFHQPEGDCCGKCVVSCPLCYLD